MAQKWHKFHSNVNTFKLEIYLAQMAYYWLKVGSYKRYLQAHCQSHTQADPKPKLWQRACKSEAKEF